MKLREGFISFYFFCSFWAYKCESCWSSRWLWSTACATCDACVCESLCTFADRTEIVRLTETTIEWVKEIAKNVVSMCVPFYTHHNAIRLSTFYRVCCVDAMWRLRTCILQTNAVCVRLCVLARATHSSYGFDGAMDWKHSLCKWSWICIAVNNACDSYCPNASDIELNDVKIKTPHNESANEQSQHCRNFEAIEWREFTTVFHFFCSSLCINTRSLNKTFQSNNKRIKRKRRRNTRT